MWQNQSIPNIISYQLKWIVGSFYSLSTPSISATLDCVKCLNDEHRIYLYGSQQSAVDICDWRVSRKNSMLQWNFVAKKITKEKKNTKRSQNHFSSGKYRQAEKILRIHSFVVQNNKSNGMEIRERVSMCMHTCICPTELDVCVCSSIFFFIVTIVMDGKLSANRLRECEKENTDWKVVLSEIINMSINNCDFWIERSFKMTNTNDKK